jgi:hypothetical protein
MKVESHIDATLGDAREMTFPASDPFSIHFPESAIDEPSGGTRFARAEAA